MAKKKTHKRDNEGKYIIPLSEPITHGNDKITEFRVSRPKAKHIRHLPKDPSQDDMLKMLGDLSCQPDSVIDELDVADLSEVTDLIESFM